jgi:putative ABC transport system ATP-binding protein
VAIAAALANDPPLILADEPTGDLDTENAMIVVNYLAKVNKELGKTIIMVTHDPRVARAAGRILRIQDGMIATDIAPGEDMAPARGDYSDILKRRLTEIDTQLSLLEADLRRGSLSGDEFVARQTGLKKTREVLSDELHRLGVVH